MKERMDKLEDKIQVLQKKDVELSTVLTAVAASLTQLVKTSQEMSNWMAADRVKEEAHKEFKKEVIHKLDKAQGRREQDSSDVKEALRISKENQTEIDIIKNDKQKSLKWWRNTAISLILLAVSTGIVAYIKGLF